MDDHEDGQADPGERNADDKEHCRNRVHCGTSSGSRGLLVHVKNGVIGVVPLYPDAPRAVPCLGGVRGGC